ncbi:MAG: alpha/beta fold hydrolase, partial [Planctomycetes bacterium]|nr:alpha/beta fold hydrolase [Planctomycetota bacterium]
MSWRGHWQTIVPRILARTPRDLPVRRLWETSLVDERVGRVAVRGRYSEGSGGPGPCILLHGLGGSPDSPYVLDTQAALHAAGRSVLALALRGTLGPPDDFYHAGLTADLERAIEALAAETGRKVDVIGFSLGGHVALRLALDPPEALGRVVTVCAPLDLRACCQTLDRRRSWIYRRHVLSGLKAHYRALAERGPVPTPWERIRRVRRIV